MKLEDIVQKLKINGFVESNFSSRMVHPKNACFVVALCYYNECDWIEIGDRLNCASLPVSSISSFMIYPGSDGIRFEIKLYNIDIEMHLFCEFEFSDFD